MAENNALEEAIGKGTTLLSLKPMADGSLSFLLISELSQSTEVSDVADFIRGTFASASDLKEQPHQGHTVFSIQPTIVDEPWFAAAKDGLLLVSMHSKNVTDALQQLDAEKSLLNDAVFAKAYKAGGKKTDATLFVHPKASATLAAQYVVPSYTNPVSDFGKFSSWISLDIGFQSQNISISGFAWIRDSTEHIGVFKGKGATATLPKWLPRQSSGYVYAGSEDLLSLAQRIETNHRSGLQDSVIQLLCGWMGKEIVLGYGNRNDTAIKAHAVLLVSVKDSLLARASLDKLQAMGTGGVLKPLSETFNGHTLKSLNQQGIFGKAFGKPFSIVHNNYYSVLGDVAVFANNSTSLKNAISAIQSERILENDETYAAQAATMASEGNLSVYLKPNVLVPLAGSLISGKHKPSFHKIAAFLQKIGGVQLMFNAQSEGHYVGGYVWFGAVVDSSETETLPEAPTFTAEAALQGHPLVLELTKNSGYATLVHDQNGNLYCLNDQAQLEWKKELKEPVLGELQWVSNFTENKAAVVFTTQNQLHAYLADGTAVSGYPVSLEAPCTSGLAVFDYDKKQDYRLVMACANNKIYNYNRLGKPTKGWASPKLKGEITQALQLFQENGKDFLVALEADKHLLLIERTGKLAQRIALEEELSAHAVPQIISGKKDKQTGIYLSKADGELVKITASGKQEALRFKAFTPNHFFLLANLDGNAGPEFIFADLNEIQVFDAEKELMGKYTWEEEIGIRPQVVKISKNEQLLNISIPALGQWWLMDHACKVAQGFPKLGVLPFGLKGKDGNLVFAAGAISPTQIVILSSSAEEQQP